MAKRAAVRQAQASTETKKPAAPTRPILSRGAVSVTVLNGNGVSGAAAAEASRVRARGHKIGVAGNATRGGYGRTNAMSRMGMNRKGTRPAHGLGVRIASP